MNENVHHSLARARARRQRERFDKLQRRAQHDMQRVQVHQMVR